MMKNNRMWVYLLVFGLLLIPFNFYFVPSVSATWWDSDWDYYRKITVDGATYVDASLTNFPLLVVLDNSSDDYTFYNSGADIRFIGTDNTTEFYYEIEKFDNGGDTFCWVNISEEIPSDDDYSFLVYYGNPSASDNQNPTDVWDSNYKGVWHMNDSTTSTIIDSTINKNDGTKKGANEPQVTASGKIDDAQDFDGSDDFVDVGSIEPAQLTLECWINGGTEDAWQKPLCKVYSNSWVGPYAEYAFTIESDNEIVFEMAGSDLVKDMAKATTGWSTNTWFYVVGTADGSNIYIHINGSAAEDSHECDGPTYSGNNKEFFIGRRWTDDTSEAFDGIIDEVRLSDIKRTNAWIKASYHTMNQTTGFMTFGSESGPTAPWLSNEYPVNESTKVELTPELYITCVDNNSDPMTALWYSNSSNGWVHFGTNTTISTTDIIKQTNTNFSVYSTEYWWAVNLTDGTLWVNNSYSFTTKPANLVPVVSNEDPTNNSVVIAVDTDLSITIEDPDGDLFNYSWTCSDGSSGSANDETNGTKTFVLDGDLAQCTAYTWLVAVTDGNDNSGSWTNRTYYFTTFCPTVPSDGYVLAWNETLTQLCVDLVDAEGDGMVYEIRQNDVVIDTGGVHVYTNTTHNFTDTVNNFAHWESSKSSMSSGIALTATTEFTSSEYQNISSVNGTGVNTSDCAPPVWSHHNFSFDLSGYTIRDITGLEVRWYGYGGYYTGGAKPKWNWGTTMYFDTDTSGWYTAGNTTPFTTDDWNPTLEWINYSAHHDMIDWIDDNNILNVAVEHTSADNCSVIYTDYIELIVTTISGGVGNGTYCTGNVSWWNDECGVEWSWVVYVTDGRGSTSTTTYTFTNAPCTFSGEVYPTTGSTEICPCTDAICVVVTVGYNFNMTVYGRSQYETNYTIWDKYVNIVADEYCFCMCGYIIDGWHQPMRYNTSYYWYVNVSKYDNSSLYNETSVFSFMTASERSACIVGGGGRNSYINIIGLCGLFAIPISFILYQRMKKRKNQPPPSNTPYMKSYYRNY